MPQGADSRPLPENPQMELPFEPTPDRGVSFLRGGARRFAESHGRTYSAHGLDQVQAQSQFQSRVAHAYEKAPVYAGDRRVAGSYAALGSEVHQQYDYLTAPRHKGGLGVNVSFEDENPYPDHKSLIEDVHVNRNLRVHRTGASADDKSTDHPFLDNETNDKFRAVHDAFGHAAIGRSFSRHGEEAAFQSHKQMFSPQAHLALMAETRAQNSAMNFGSSPGQFPEQKPVALPQWMIDRTHPATR